MMARCLSHKGQHFVLCFDLAAAFAPLLMPHPIHCNACNTITPTHPDLYSSILSPNRCVPLGRRQLRQRQHSHVRPTDRSFPRTPPTAMDHCAARVLQQPASGELYCSAHHLRACGVLLVLCCCALRSLLLLACLETRVQTHTGLQTSCRPRHLLPSAVPLHAPGVQRLHLFLPLPSLHEPAVPCMESHEEEPAARGGACAARRRHPGVTQVSRVSCFASVLLFK